MVELDPAMVVASRIRAPAGGAIMSPRRPSQ
jgi:hypothetical protein